MIKRITVASSLFLVVTGTVLSQEAEQPKRLPSIFVGAGVLAFDGDIGQGLGMSSFTRFRSGFNFGLEQRFGSAIGVSLSGLIGKLADSDHGINRNLNFESPIQQGELNIIFHFDNNFIFKNSSVIAPYIQAGIGYLMFDPHGDLKDKNGVVYNYWSDGSIRDLPETVPPSPKASVIQRDYIYETQLKDPNDSYKRSSLVFPMSLGFKLNATQHIALNLQGTYCLTMTDRIDNIKDGNNDAYIYGNVSVEYKFFKKSKNSSGGSVDFSALDKLDTDEDGVADKDDRCPGTEKGVVVDTRGCPVDTDQDGIPDYKDKEPNSAKGAIVDINGVTVTDKTLAEKAKDSTATERSTLFKQNPSVSSLKTIENQIKEDRKTQKTTSKIPASLQPADTNKDGMIATNEIIDAIDAFFQGNSFFTIEKLNSLIDYFFEQ